MTTPLDEIRRLYFAATAATIAADFDRAIDLLKAMASEDERGRAAVFMEGLAEMKKQWAGFNARGSGRGKPLNDRRPERPRKPPIR